MTPQYCTVGSRYGCGLINTTKVLYANNVRWVVVCISPGHHCGVVDTYWVSLAFFFSASLKGLVLTGLSKPLN